MRSIAAQIVLVSCFLFLVANSVFAAEDVRIYLETENAGNFKVGSTVTVSVFADSAQPINAYEAEINYPVDFLEFVSFNTAHSIIDFWRDSPKNFENGVIKFQGGGRNPLSGSRGEILKINFIAKKEGRADLIFKNAVFYLADGKGTVLKPVFSEAALTISKNAPLVPLQVPDDTTAPVISNLEIAENPIDNFKLVIFQTEDSGSGIKESYVGFKKWLAWRTWMPVSNPFALPGDVWAYRLKTVDNGGNTAEKTVYLWDVLAVKLIFIAILSGVLAAIGNIVRRRFPKTAK